MISRNSRYARRPVGTDQDDRRFIGGRHQILKTSWPDNRAHTVQEGDTLWALAFRYLGDAELWWIIADFNGIVNPLKALQPGRVLIIPSQRTVHEEMLP